MASRNGSSRSGRCNLPRVRNVVDDVQIDNLGQKTWVAVIRSSQVCGACSTVPGHTHLSALSGRFSLVSPEKSRVRTSELFVLVGLIASSWSEKLEARERFLRGEPGPAELDMELAVSMETAEGRKRGEAWFELA